MPPLHDVPEFAWLPELFSIVGHERLIMLAKYAGGETIRIPTLIELLNSVDALQWFYDVELSHVKSIESMPEHLYPLYHQILEVYNVRNHSKSNQSGDVK